MLKERELFIENEKINFRETGIIKDLNQLYTFWVSKGERIMILDDETDFELVESNGQIFKTEENTLIVWPGDAKELYWKLKLNEEVPDFEKNRKLMVKWLQEYLKKSDAS